MRRAPIPPALPSQDTLDEFLDENDLLLQTGMVFQKQAHVIESIEFVRRTQVNLVAMVRLLRRQQELERLTIEPSVQQTIPAKEIALKKPPVKRRRKSEVTDDQPSVCEQTPDNNIKPLDMPSLL